MFSHKRGPPLKANSFKTLLWRVTTPLYLFDSLLIFTMSSRNMSHTIRVLIIQFFVLFNACFVASLSHAETNDEVMSSSVLLLNSYHPQYRWTQQLTQGVQDALSDSIATENLHIEYMDARRNVGNKEYASQLKRLLEFKYKSYVPDLIITSDDHAFYFMLQHGEALFPGKPVVFSGVNVVDEKVFEGRDNVTGIIEGMEIEGNLALIQRLQPDVQKIIMLGDETELGGQMVKKARAIQMQWQADPFKKSIALEVWDKFSLNELYEKAAKASEDTAFLMLAILKDEKGSYFSFEKELPILSSRSRAPVYGMWGGLMIGNGIVGGMLNDPYVHGSRVASMALAILSGVPPSEIEIQKKSIFSPVFDYRQLTRFDIPLELLPVGSEVVNKPVSVYEENKPAINGIISFVLFLILIITILIRNNRQRFLAQKLLAGLNKELEDKVAQRTKDLQARNADLEFINDRMDKMAHTDVLTGLGNRRAADKDVASFIARGNGEKDNFSLAILDIDFFKRVNDTYGHQAGDDVLFQVAQSIKDALRPSDRVYRWGGEEFLLALPDTSEQFAAAVCQRVRNSINDHVHPLVGSVTASIGVTTLQSDDNIDSLVNRCDEYLYFAKENGRDQVVARSNYGP